MRSRSLLAAMLLGLGLAAGAGATPIPVTFFHSPADDGSPATLPINVAAVGNITINLWADPTAAAGGITFEVQDVLLQVSGGLSIVSFTCDSGQGGCLKGAPASPATQIFFTAGDATNGNSAAFTIGTVVLAVSGPGEMTLMSGTALDGNFNGDGIIPHVVLSVTVPEPLTAALLAIGLGGLALLGRKRSA